MPEAGPQEWRLWGAQPMLCGLRLRLPPPLVGHPTSGCHTLLVPAEAGPAVASGNWEVPAELSQGFLCPAGPGSLISKVPWF